MNPSSSISYVQSLLIPPLADSLSPHLSSTNLALALTPPLASTMAPEIRFTTFGIPYLVEFANVKFRSVLKRRHACPKPDRKRSRSSSGSSVGSDTTLHSSISTASSETLASTYENDADGEGLFIQFASHCSQPRQALTEGCLMRLKYKIANAAAAAGMTAPSAADNVDPVNRAMCRLSRRFEAQNHDPQQRVGSTSSFYRGTYGQLMDALESAGLMTTPCKASGIQDGEFSSVHLFPWFHLP